MKTSSPAPKKSFWQRLTAPHPDVTDFSEQRFASVLATLLLALLPFYFLPEGIRAIVERHPWNDVVYFWGGIVTLSLAYIFARSPHPRWGARLTLLYFSVLPFASLVTLPERYGGENAYKSLIWSVPIMLMALILLPPKDIKWVVLLQIGLYLVIPAIWDRLTYDQVFSVLWLVIAVGGLMIVSAFVQSHYLARVVYEAQQNQAVKERYRELFDFSPTALWEADLSVPRKALDFFPGEIKPEKAREHVDFFLPLVSRLPLNDVNQAAVKLFEARDENQAKKEWLQVLNVDDTLVELAVKMAEMWKGFEFLPSEFTLKTFQGKRIEVLLEVSFADKTKKDWSSVIFSAIDITERKKAEKRFRDLFLTSPVALLEADFSAIKSRLDEFAEKYSDVKQHILAHPESMVGAGGSVRLLDANFRALELYEAESRTALLDSLYLAVSPSEMLALRDGVIALWGGIANHPIETIHHSMQGHEKNVVVRFSTRPGYEDTWEYVNISVDDVTERRAAEASARQLASAVEASASSIVITDTDGAIEYVNPAFLNVTGYSKEEVLGENPRVLKSGKHSPEFYKEMWETLIGGNVWRGELINKKQNGELYWERASISPVKDEAGETQHYVAVKDDITAVKEAEQELRKLSRAAEQTASGVLITDLNGVIEFANPAAARITGYEVDELIGGTPNMLKSGMHDKAFYNELWQTIQRGETWRGELINRRKDGSLYWESMVISSVKNEAGELTHYVAVKEDITERKETAEQLRYLSRATEQTASGIVITDAEGLIEYINPAFTRITGFSLPEIKGKTLDIQRSDEHPQVFYDDLDETMARGDIWQGEIINRRKDGSLYWEALTVSPITDEEGQITHRVLVKEDITRRKELEQALALAHEEALVASDMKTQLLANVSHDMRTPLGAILGYTEMLSEGVFEPLNEKQTEATRAIAASSQRLLNFVTDLLNQAQIETGKIVLKELPFRPRQIINNLGGEISLARTRGMTINTHVDEALPKEILGDAYWLGQIVHNLLSNAIKFTPVDGEISVELLRSGEFAWVMKVADNGKGIPKEAQQYIFESFRQVDGSTSREAHQGSGLGLSIVQHLVQLMDGEINLESEFGKGSAFSILLPLKTPEENEK